MYKLKKDDFNPKEKHQTDRRYFIDVFRRLGATEDDEFIYLPDETIKPLKEAEIDDIVYNYFELVWANEEKEINIEDVVGSHDYRNYSLKTWLANFLYNGISEKAFSKYLQDPNSIFDSKENSLKTFEKDGKQFLADGHHRFSCLYLHYHILKSQDKLPSNFNTSLKSIVRVVPNDINFITRFVKFCVDNRLYDEDEFGIIPSFEVLDSNPDNPTIMHTESKVKITKDSNLDEVLKEIKTERKSK